MSALGKRRRGFWSDIRWAFAAAAREPDVRKTMRRSVFSYGALLAVVAALLAHKVSLTLH